MGNLSGVSVQWYFIKRDLIEQRELLAVKVDNAKANRIPGTSLPNFAIENPTTLVLHNVDARYNGKYQFVIQGRGYQAEIEFYVSGKFLRTSVL